MTESNADCPSSDPPELLALIRSNDHITLTHISGGGIRLHLKPGKNEFTKISLACFICGLLAVVCGWLFRNSVPDVLQDSSFRYAPYYIMGLGALNMGLAPVFLLIRAVTGPPGDSILEASCGKLFADRTGGGDRMVSNYTDADIHCLFVDANLLFVSARKGDLPLASFGKRDVNIAVATVLAARLWPVQQLGQYQTSLAGVKRWIIMPVSGEPKNPIG